MLSAFVNVCETLLIRFSIHFSIHFLIQSIGNIIRSRVVTTVRRRIFHAR